MNSNEVEKYRFTEQHQLCLHSHYVTRDGETSDLPKRDFAASDESEALADPFAEASAEYRSFG